MFLVKKGNPKAIKDWDDLARPGADTGHHAESQDQRWRALELSGLGVRPAQEPRAGAGNGAGEAQARDFVARLYRNVPVLDSSARGATMTFVQRAAWAMCCWPGRTRPSWRSRNLAKAASDRGALRFHAGRARRGRGGQGGAEKGTRALAEAYLQHLYSDEGQEIAARHHYRPRSDKVRPIRGPVPRLTLATIDQAFGGWSQAPRITLPMARALTRSTTSIEPATGRATLVAGADQSSTGGSRATSASQAMATSGSMASAVLPLSSDISGMP